MRCSLKWIQHVWTKTTYGRKWLIYRIKGAVKRKFYLPHEELLDGVEEEAEQFDRTCPNLATEDTYGGGGEDEVRVRREDNVEEVTADKRFVSGVDAS